MPFVVAKRPCCRWTVTAATTITATTSAGPIGPRNPVATSKPPTISVAAAAAAKKRPGRNPSDSKYPLTAVRPYPPNHPKSFCEPCAAIKSPNTRRATSNPVSIRTPFAHLVRRSGCNYIKYSDYMSSSYLRKSCIFAILLTMAGLGSHPPKLCARFHRASELIGRRWTGAIIFVLLRSGCRFATLREAIPDITDRMLSDRLQELEDEAIVERTVVPDTPVRVEYALTKKGRELSTAFEAIGAWAHKWVEADTAVRRKSGAPAKRR